MDEYLPHIPTIDVLNPPQTIFDVPVADVPYLDPVLLPSLEQVESGLGSSGSSVEEETSSSKEEALELVPEPIPTNLPNTKELLSTEEPVATFNIPFINYEFPVPSPEVIASSVIASSVSATAAVTGSIVLQSVVNQLKKIMTKIFKKVLKKEIADNKK